LTDPGFDFSVLCEFRARLLEGKAEQRLLDTLLTLGRERGWLKARGKQRTDSTHVLAAVRALNRVECVGETLRNALNTLAEIAPDWLGERLPLDWIDRYAKRFASIRLPQQKAERERLAITIGEDGFALMKRLRQSDAPTSLWSLPEVQLLRLVWIQNYVFQEGKLGWRDTKDMPTAAQSINSPHDPQARYSIKRDTTWSGYKVHFTETCDDASPHLITPVQTTVATTQDGQVTATVHADLKTADLLPARHLVDEAYLDAQLLVESPRTYGIDLYGPVARESSWQAVANEGFGNRQFQVDWDNQRVQCPQGKASSQWKPSTDASGNEVIFVKFARSTCGECPHRSQCTRSKTTGRELSLRPQEQYLALQTARERQKIRLGSRMRTRTALGRHGQSMCLFKVGAATSTLRP
jgi:transposase